MDKTKEKKEREDKGKNSTKGSNKEKMINGLFAYELKIPKERIAVIIGKQGKVKKEIEQDTKTKITIDSKEGDVLIEGNDGLLLYSAREIIRAIGRGFNPDIAMQLLKQDYSFEVIRIGESKNKNNLKRIKGRIIGEKGKTRRIIEQSTDTSISVYGKTVGIIGAATDIRSAREAVEMLIKGSKHATVYRMLERKRKEKRAFME